MGRSAYICPNMSCLSTAQKKNRLGRSLHVIVGDPAIGQRTLTPKEFETGWTGYALLLQPTALLKDAKDKTTSLWKFFELVKPHHKVLVEIFFASVLIQLFGLVTPVFTQLLLDRVLVQRSFTTLNAIALGMIIFGLFRVIMGFIQKIFTFFCCFNISKFQRVFSI